MRRQVRFLLILLIVLASSACLCPLPSPWSPTPVASPTIKTEPAEGVTISSGTTDSTGRTVVTEPNGSELAVVEVRDADSEEPIQGIDVYLLRKGSRYLVVAVHPEEHYLASWRDGFIDELGAGTSSEHALGSLVLARAAHAQALPVVLILLKVVSTVSSVEDLAAYLQDPPDFEYWGVLYEERCWTGEQLANYVGAAGLVIPGGEMEYFMEAIYLMSQHVIEQDLKEYSGNLERPVRIRIYHLGIPFLGMVPVGWCDSEDVSTLTTPLSTAPPIGPSPTAPGSFDRATPGGPMVTCHAGAGRAILYTSALLSGGSDVQIFTICAEDRLSTQLTTAHLALYNREPVWSPDGRHVAFAAQYGHNTHSDIFIIGADGSDPTQLTSVGSNASPAWSPDGQGIAFLRTSQYYIEIWLTRADGSDQKRLTSGSMDLAPSWSPDGSWVLFQRGLGLMSSAEMFIIRPDGSQLTRLAGEHCNLEPVWSPDGQWIAFRRAGCGMEQVGGGIFVIRPDGSQEKQLTFNESDGSLSWSPDAERIAFTRLGSNYKGEIFVIGTDGSQETQVTFTEGLYEDCPCWSPDGERIAYLCDRSEDEPSMHNLDPEIFVIRPDGSERTQLTINTDDDGCPSWWNAATRGWSEYIG